VRQSYIERIPDLRKWCSHLSIFVSVVMLWSPPARSQSEAERAFSVSPIYTAKNLLSRLYPELLGKGYLAKVELSAPIDRDWTSTPEFGFVVSESMVAPSKPSAKVGARPTLFTERPSSTRSLDSIATEFWKICTSILPEYFPMRSSIIFAKLWTRIMGGQTYKSKMP